MFSLRHDGVWRALRRFALLFVSLLLTVGCGSSSGVDAVVGTNSPASGSETGDLTFRFVQAQVALEVPREGARLRFEFFQGVNGSGSMTLPTQVLDMAPEITVRGVPVSTRSVVITVLDQHNVPLLRSTLNVTVSPGYNKSLEFVHATTEAVTLSSLSLSPTEALIGPGERHQFRATATYSNGDVLPALGVTWASSRPAVASVDSNGVASGLSDGMTTIAATSGEVSSGVVLQVLTPVATTLTLSPDGDNVARGASKQYTLSALDQLGRPMQLGADAVQWSASGGFEIESQTPTSALVQALSTGEASLTATVDGASATVHATIIEPNIDGIVSVTPSPVALTINPTTTATLVTLGSFGSSPPRALTVAGDGLSYVVGDLGVISVANDGLVTPVAVGQTTITAQVGSFTQTVQVAVTNAQGNEPPTVGFDQHRITISQGDGPHVAFTNVTVTDDQANLSGGQLLITAKGTNSEVVLQAPAAVVIGTVTGDGTKAFTVDLDSRATPSKIRDFVAGVTLSSTANKPLGLGSVSVGISDGLSGDNFGSEPAVDYLVIGQGAAIYNVPANHATVQLAVDAASAAGKPGAAIFVSAGTYDSVVAIGTEIGDNTGLNRLQIFGNNAGITAGVLARGQVNPPRKPETIIPRFSTIFPAGVTLDGLTITGASGGQHGVVLVHTSDGFTVRNSVFTGVSGSGSGVHFEVNEPLDTLLFEDNLFSAWQNGLRMRGSASPRLSNGHMVRRNIFESNDQGISINFPDGGGIIGNSFQGNSTHLFIQYYFSGWNTTPISFNDFNGVRLSLSWAPTGLVYTANYWGAGGPPTGDPVGDPEPSDVPFTNYPGN